MSQACVGLLRGLQANSNTTYCLKWIGMGSSLYRLVGLNTALDAGYAGQVRLTRIFVCAYQWATSLLDRTQNCIIPSALERVRPQKPRSIHMIWEVTKRLLNSAEWQLLAWEILRWWLKWHPVFAGVLLGLRVTKIQSKI